MYFIVNSLSWDSLVLSHSRIFPNISNSHFFEKFNFFAADLFLEINLGFSLPLLSPPFLVAVAVISSP